MHPAALAKNGNLQEICIGSAAGPACARLLVDWKPAEPPLQAQSAAKGSRSSLLPTPNWSRYKQRPVLRQKKTTTPSYMRGRGVSPLSSAATPGRMRSLRDLLCLVQGWDEEALGLFPGSFENLLQRRDSALLPLQGCRLMPPCSLKPAPHQPSL